MRSTAPWIRGSAAESAIKVSAKEYGNRFEREARAISALNHAHICTLYDVGPNYLVMELCEGETMAARLKRGPLSLDQTLQYGAQIADALAEAHSKGIIHRDFKPGNIMITRSGVKVLDFGLARSSGDDTITARHAVMGTPAYMAPEQREGRPCDARSDIYSFGLVLSEMATGKPASLDSVPAALTHVMERCLEPEPESRWQSARDIKALLEWAERRSRYGFHRLPDAASMAMGAGRIGVCGHWRRCVVLRPSASRRGSQPVHSLSQRDGGRATSRYAAPFARWPILGLFGRLCGTLLALAAGIRFRKVPPVAGHGWSDHILLVPG